MTAYGERLDVLWREIDVYLAFMDIARELDNLWAEYKAFKSLADRTKPYTMKS